VNKDMTRTPRSRVKNAIRQLSLRSREAGYARKVQKNTCQRCGVKGTSAKGREVKTQMHHVKGIDWEGVVDLIFERVLQRPDDYECLCKDCHDKETAKETE
jgi:5-methylcytosine-specific restriction endonuclease McrA